MAVRKLGGFVLVVAVVLAFGTSWGATPASSASIQKTIKVGGDKLEVAGQFAFDPILKSGKFIAGEFSCVALGVNTTLITMNKCYLVLSTGATYVAAVKSSSTFVKVYKVLTNVPAVNITQCITTTAKFKDGSTQVVHISGAPNGETKLPCKLG